METLKILKAGDKVKTLDYGVEFTVDFIQDGIVVAYIYVENRCFHHSFTAEEIELVQQ